MENAIAAISIIVLLSGILIVTGLKKKSGIGVIAVLIMAALSLWLRKEGLGTIGFTPPGNWSTVILLGLGLGIAVQIFSIMLIEPLSERITNEGHDHRIVENVKGNWLAFMKWMIMVWVFVAVLEEGLYRGFLMTEITKVLGTSSISLIFNVLITSTVFGLSHGYQNRSGIISTGVLGAILGTIFIMSDFNLWLAIFTHGFIDTIGIGIIAIDKEKALKELVWGKKT